MICGKLETRYPIPKWPWWWQLLDVTLLWLRYQWSGDLISLTKIRWPNCWFAAPVPPWVTLQSSPCLPSCQPTLPTPHLFTCSEEAFESPTQVLFQFSLGHSLRHQDSKRDPWEMLGTMRLALRVESNSFSPCPLKTKGHQNGIHLSFHIETQFLKRLKLKMLIADNGIYECCLQNPCHENMLPEIIHLKGWGRSSYRHRWGGGAGDKKRKSNIGII